VGITAKELKEAEFDVFTKLSFSLFVNPNEIIPVYTRLKNSIEVSQ